MKKIKPSRIHKSNVQAQKEADLSKARAGDCITSVVGKVSDLPGVVSSALPEGMYVTFDDFMAAIKKVAQTLRQIQPSHSILMLNRAEALRLILTLVIAHRSEEDLLGEEFHPQAVVKEHEKELETVSRQVMKLLKSTNGSGMTIERFRAAMRETSNPELAQKILESMSANAPMLQSSSGPIHLEWDKSALRDLPSAKLHEMEVQVTRGFDDRASTVGVNILSLKDADPELFKPGQEYSVLCSDDMMRDAFLLMQLTKNPLQISVEAPRVPIYPGPRSQVTLSVSSVQPIDVNSLSMGVAHLMEQLQLPLNSQAAE